MNTNETNRAIFAVSTRDVQDIALDMIGRQLSERETGIVADRIGFEFRHFSCWLEEYLLLEFGE